MISALDSRYLNRLEDLSAFLGEENFIFWMARWSIEYVNATHGLKLQHYSDEKELFKRVTEYEKTTKHQMTALLKVLKEDFPAISFHQGLTSEDIMHNARWSQVIQALEVVSDETDKIRLNITEICSTIKTDILGHTHGQPATPINCEKYLNAKISEVTWFYPKFRMGGSNGQLTSWKLIFKLNPEEVAFRWATEMVGKFFIDKTMEYQILVPHGNTGLLQHGPANTDCITACIRNALLLRSLARALWDHCNRKILTLKNGEGQTGSSAMPHKVNPIDFEQAEGAFSNSYHLFINILEANCDSRGLRDLSNSIVNRTLADALAYMYLGCSSLNKGMKNAGYSHRAIQMELQNNPECLSELVRYMRVNRMGEQDETVYDDLKNNPLDNYNLAVNRMKINGMDINII